MLRDKKVKTRQARTRSSYTFRLPDDLRDRLEARAAEENRTLSQMMILLLDRAVSDDRA